MFIIRLTQFFPLFALMISALAYFYPSLFTGQSAGVVPLLGLIMLSMGTTLSTADLKRFKTYPKPILIGILLQFLLMPFLAYLMAGVFQLDDAQTIGLVMVGAVGGGTASNVMTYLAGGDVALSITMTFCSTLIGIVMTPLLASIYLDMIVAVPAWDIFKSLLYLILIPVSFGFLIRYMLSKYVKMFSYISPLCSMVFILWVIAIVVALNHDAILESGIWVMLAVILHNILGLSFGYIFARLLRCDKTTAITISIEVGMQNSGLAVALCKQFFAITSTLPGALFSIWHNLSGAVLAGIAQYTTKENVRN